MRNYAFIPKTNTNKKIVTMFKLYREHITHTTAYVDIYNIKLRP